MQIQPQVLTDLASVPGSRETPKGSRSHTAARPLAADLLKASCAVLMKAGRIGSDTA